eukprot:1537996-Prymnesium_polylepis.1
MGTHLMVLSCGRVNTLALSAVLQAIRVVALAKAFAPPSRLKKTNTIPGGTVEMAVTARGDHRILGCFCTEAYGGKGRCRLEEGEWTTTRSSSMGATGMVSALAGWKSDCRWVVIWGAAFAKVPSAPLFMTSLSHPTAHFLLLAEHLPDTIEAFFGGQKAREQRSSFLQAFPQVPEADVPLLTFDRNNWEEPFRRIA